MNEGIKIGEKGYIEKTADLHTGQLVYELPDDLGTLLYLSVSGVYIKSIDGREVMLEHAPTFEIPQGMTIRYLPKEEAK